jgi:hypothetical protein
MTRGTAEEKKQLKLIGEDSLLMSCESTGPSTGETITQRELTSLPSPLLSPLHSLALPAVASASYIRTSHRTMTRKRMLISSPHNLVRVGLARAFSRSFSSQRHMRKKDAGQE